MESMRNSKNWALAMVVFLFLAGTAAATDLEITPIEDFNSTGQVGGPFTPASKDYQLTNVGPNSFWYGVYEAADWLIVEPDWGPLGSGQSVIITVSLTPEANLLGEGFYAETLTFLDITNNEEQTREATLTIALPGGIWVSPASFDVNVIETLSLTELLTIGNSGVEELNFTIRTRNLGSSIESVGRSNIGLAAEKGVAFSVLKGHDFTIAGNTAYKPGELIVRFSAKANGQMRNMSEKNQILSSLGGGTVKWNFSIVPGLSVVKLPEGMTVESALQIFNGAGGIFYAEPNYEVKTTSTFPDDPRFDDLWGMHNTGQTGGTVDADIDAPEAWDIATGSSEIIVAVIDTGVDYTHPDLASNMWVNEAEFNGNPGQDDDGNGYVDDIYGYDFCNYDGNPMDDHYHGTHCAGTIGAVGNNGEGVAGVNWNVRIMAIKFLSSSGSGWADDAIKSIEYSTLMGANLSSNSWGGGSYSQGLKDVIDAAGAAGMLFMASAGNSGSNNDNNPHYPSSYDCESLVAVMATNKYDNKASFSSYGPTSVDLGAPGVDILSCSPGSSYRYLDGTSMACPHVAGASALLWSMNPMMSNTEVKNILLETVDKTLTGLCVSEGRLNLYNAILETKAPWLEIEPEEGVVGSGGSVDVNVTFNAAELTPGTYEAEILILSDDPCNSTMTIGVTMTVEADDLQMYPAEDFESSGTRGGPFEPACMIYTLSNAGDESLYWTTSGTEDWLGVEPSEGILGFGESIDVNVCITSYADQLDPNIYTQILVFENTNSGAIRKRSVSLTVNPPDCFTESFDGGDNNLDNLLVTFSPDGSVAYYEACRERIDEFPTDPGGGTTVALGDDDFVEVILSNDVNVSFYGVSYDRFYIGSNGYITFGDGDMEYEDLLENHFSLPRISALFDDLTPADTHSISYKQFGDRVAVTFEEVPLYGDKEAKNSFQIEMFFVDGTICITWLDIDDREGIAGLSEGYGFPPTFIESNLRGYSACRPYCDFDRDYDVDMNDLAVFVLHWLDEDCNVPYWCGKTDLDFSSIVEMGDYAICAESWMVSYDWWLEPIAHWKFDEGQGDIAYDSAGNNDGALIGPPEWVDGQIGDYGLDFDGAGDYVEMGDTVRNYLGTSYTVSAWIKADVIAPHKVIAAYRQSSLINPSVLFQLDHYNADARFIVRDDFGNIAKAIYSNAITAGIWYHVAGVREGNTLNVYVNGVSGTSDSQTFGTINSDNLKVGAFQFSDNPPGSFFDGTIDDVRIYDRALSKDEILTLYCECEGSNKAFNPKPADRAIGMDPNTILTWTSGCWVLSHDVYLGTDFDDLNDATPDSNEYMGNFDVNSYDPCGLDPATTYYWRVDEKNVFGTAKGDVWGFTTWHLNPVGWWEFEEGTGGIAYDSSGNGNDGTLNGPPTWVAGKVGDYALDFDGVDDYIEVPDNDGSLDVINSLTISAWVNLNNIDTSYSIANKQPSGTWRTNYPGNYEFRMNEGSLELGHQTGTGDLEYSFYMSTSGIEAGTWHHVAVTLVEDGDVNFYIDGSPAGTSPQSGTFGVLNDEPVRIGTRKDAWYYLDGLTDDIRIYDRALSAEEIELLYQAGL